MHVFIRSKSRKCDSLFPLSSLSLSSLHFKITARTRPKTTSQKEPHIFSLPVNKKSALQRNEHEETGLVLENQTQKKKKKNPEKMQKMSLLFLLLISIACSGFMNLVCGNAEVRALMEIKASLDPENKHLSSWTAGGDPCAGAFEGVACNEHRKVANISLQGKGLTGKVSPAVAELKCLSGLFLHYNFLSGEIPKEIANLTELNDLYLNVNNLTGIIPPQIGSMASLQGLSNLSFSFFFCRFYGSWTCEKRSLNFGQL